MPEPLNLARTPKKPSQIERLVALMEAHARRLLALEKRPAPVNGRDGQPGAIGPIGPQGAIGPQGEDGPRGEIGPQGLAGPVGPQGEIGPQGLRGEDGQAGKDGTNGKDGIGIASGFQDADGNLVVTLTNGQAINFGCFRGADGKPGKDAEPPPAPPTNRKKRISLRRENGQLVADIEELG